MTEITATTAPAMTSHNAHRRCESRTVRRCSGSPGVPAELSVATESRAYAPIGPPTPLFARNSRPTVGPGGAGRYRREHEGRHHGRGRGNQAAPPHLQLAQADDAHRQRPDDGAHRGPAT